MKKVLYSGYTKAIALVLCVASVVSVSLTAARGILDYFREGEGVYALEDSFSETRFFMPYLNAPADAIWNAYVFELGEAFPQGVGQNPDPGNGGGRGGMPSGSG